jgi:microcompartment protein CcmK/EutM
MDAMRTLGGQLDEAGIDRDKMQADDSVATDIMGSTLSGMVLISWGNRSRTRFSTMSGSEKIDICSAAPV